MLKRNKNKILKTHDENDLFQESRATNPLIPSNTVSNKPRDAGAVDVANILPVGAKRGRGGKIQTH